MNNIAELNIYNGLTSIQSKKNSIYFNLINLFKIVAKDVSFNKLFEYLETCTISCSNMNLHGQISVFC